MLNTPNIMKSINFRKLNQPDYHLLHKWLQLEHIRKFWHDGDRNIEQVITHYSEPDYCNRFIIEINNFSVGYIQSYDVQESSILQYIIVGNLMYFLGIDIFIGELEYLNKGYAKCILQQFIEKFGGNHNGFVVDPEISNLKAIHIYKSFDLTKITELHNSDKKYSLMLKLA
jgi:hypothetical protein